MSLDRYITGNYGEDQFPKSSQTKRTRCNCTPAGRGHWLECTRCGGRIHRPECKHAFNADKDCFCVRRALADGKEGGE